jgi:Leucine-rich repeat (LRR) protein
VILFQLLSHRFLITSVSAVDSVPEIGPAQTTNNVLGCDIKKYNGQESRREPTLCIAKFNPGVSSNSVQIHTFELKPGLAESEFIYEIIVKEQVMHYIPYLNTNLFKNIVKFIIQKTNLKEIHKEDFQQFPELAILEIRNTDLTTIDKDLFELNPKLKNVILTGNKITSIPFEAILRIMTFETDVKIIKNDLNIIKTIEKCEESKLQNIEKDAKIIKLQTEIEKYITENNNETKKNNIKTDFAPSNLINFVIIALTLACVVCYVVLKCYNHKTTNHHDRRLSWPSNQQNRISSPQEPIEVQEYEVPLPYEDHIYSEIN